MIQSIEKFCVQGSQTFGNYLKSLEEKYVININVGGFLKDTFYELKPTIDGTSQTLPHSYYHTDKTVIHFDDFMEKYALEFENLLLVNKECNSYSII
jgi:hypothetical protein